MADLAVAPAVRALAADQDRRDVLVDVGENDLRVGRQPVVEPNPLGSRFPSLRLPSVAARPKASGDDIRRDLVFDEGDAIAQLQLALLQPLQPQQIRRRRLMQRVDRCVEIAVLLLQPGEFVFELALIFVGHGVR